MTSGTAASAADPAPDSTQFSLVHGGPLFQLLLKAHLTGDALNLTGRRIVAFVLISWLPLLVLATRDGHLFGGHLTVPFLTDVETHVRFLVVVPLLLAAELIVHRRLLGVAGTFLERKLVPADALPRFHAALAAASRLRNSLLAEVLLLACVYVVGVFIVWRHYTGLDTSAWFAITSATGPRLSPAGKWYAYVSLPIFQFLLLRWYFRVAIWTRFLWQVSRVDLALVPTHPDQLGGLGFLGNTVYAFSLLLAAHGAMLAAQIANRIFYVGAALTDFKLEIAVLLGFLMAAVFGPMLVFSPKLARARREGLNEYGLLAQRYVREFDHKWVRGRKPDGEPLLGSADIQSLADMGNSFAVVRSMRLAPITRNAVLPLAACVLVPLIPLLLTVMPVEELARKLLGLVL
ncbi:MAG: hypothetical protein JSR36_15130 [Proteobacteria bacterium]|nr:hypothetical protein [Pseudomonadota bacterium]